MSDLTSSLITASRYSGNFTKTSYDVGDSFDFSSSSGSMPTFVLTNTSSSDIALNYILIKSGWTTIMSLIPRHWSRNDGGNYRRNFQLSSFWLSSGSSLTFNIGLVYDANGNLDSSSSRVFDDTTKTSYTTTVSTLTATDKINISYTSPSSSVVASYDYFSKEVVSNTLQAFSSNLTVTVVYNDSSSTASASITNFPVNVYPYVFSSIELDYSNAKTKFYVGETYASTGLIVYKNYVKYISGSSATSVETSDYSTNRDGEVFSSSNLLSNLYYFMPQVEVSVTENGTTKKATYDLIVYGIKSVRYSTFPSKVLRDTSGALPNTLPTTASVIYSDANETTESNLTITWSLDVKTLGSKTATGSITTHMVNDGVVDTTTTSETKTFTDTTTVVSSLTSEIQSLSIIGSNGVVLSTDKNVITPINEMQGSTYSLVGKTLKMVKTDGTIYTYVITSSTSVPLTDGTTTLTNATIDKYQFVVSGQIYYTEIITLKVPEYDDETAYVYLGIYPKFNDGINAVVTSEATTTYYTKATLNKTGINVYKKKYNSSDNSWVNGDSISSSDWSFNPTTSGDTATSSKTIEIVYGSDKTTISIEVLAVTETSFTLKDNSFSLGTYYSGQELAIDTTGSDALTFVIGHNNGSNTDLAYYGNESNIELYYLNGSEEVELEQNSSLTTAMNGKTVYAKYSTFEAVSIGTLSVTAKAFVDEDPITRDTGNTFRTAYNVGDYFTKEGLKLIAHYNSGDESITENTSGVTFTINNGNTYDSTTATSLSVDYQFKTTDYNSNGNKTISLFYDGQRHDFVVSLSKGTLKEISLDYSDSRLQTEFTNGSSAFTCEYLKVYAVMSNDYEIELTQSNGNSSTISDGEFYVDTTDLDINASGKIACGSGVETLKVYGAYGTITSSSVNYATYDVNILANTTIKALRVDTSEEDYYNQYVVGETIGVDRLKGVKVSLVYEDDTVLEDITSFTTYPEKGSAINSAGKKTIRIIYNNGTFSAEKTIDIYVYLSENANYSTNDYKIAFNIASITRDDYVENNGVITFYEVATKQENSVDVTYRNYYRYPLFLSGYIETFTKPTSGATDLDKDLDGKNYYTGSSASSDCVGYIDFGSYDNYENVIANAKVVLFEDYANTTSGDGNIVVKFPHYVEGESDKINKCTFGKVFNNRLFVSGNSNYKNYDWHTSSVATSDDQVAEPFTYFSDLDYCAYGSTDTAVVGYDVYRDGDLIVVKSGSRKEATLYRREASYITATDSSGTQISGQIEEAYPCYDINSNGGEGGLNNRSIINFMGSTIILTRNGLKTLTTNEKVNSSEKYATDVSSYINYKIKNESLDNSILYSYKEKLYLKTSRGLYVGDYNKRNDDDEYEWFYYDITDIDNFFEYDGLLYFTKPSSLVETNGSAIYRFNRYSTFIDKNRVYLGVGSIITDATDDDETTDTIVYNASYDDYIKDGYTFNLKTEYTSDGKIDTNTVMHGYLGKFINYNVLRNQGLSASNYTGIAKQNNNVWYIELNTINDYLFYDGLRVYFDDMTESISDNTPKISTGDYANRYYVLKEITDDLSGGATRKYQILFNNSPVALNLETSFRLSYRINNSSVSLINAVNKESDVDTTTTGEQHSFKLKGADGNTIDIIKYANQTLNLSGVITIPSVVEAYYETKPYNFNSLLYDKTIWLWTITNDSNLSSQFNLSYFINGKANDEKLLAIKNITQLNFNNVDFSTIKFTSNVLPHVYSKNRIINNIQFIRFLLWSEDNSNMVLGQLSMLYTLSQLTKGVK